MPRLSPLPIDALIPDVVAALESQRSLVLQASPGAGKTTRVPPALLGAAFARGKRILVLEPRRLAAKYAARRVAEELGEQPGQTVGYRFRFENVGGRNTRLIFLTEGMLMRQLLSDPTLDGVAAVVLDEFHERHLHGDTALAYLRSLQLGRRADLRLIVMSATLDAAPIAAYLDGCPVLTSEVRQYPVDVSYHAGTKPLETQVKDGVAQAMREGDGDCLVFLPGMADIRRAESALTDVARGNRWRVFPLHAELPRDEQDLALRRGDTRKVVLATNVAETSLTIEGVSAVVDSGLHRLASYSWWSGIPKLHTKGVSRASAIQRAGRAGRTGPGRCLRLYGKADFDGRPAFDPPELHRADLAQIYLELRAMGIADPAALPWLEPPPAASLDAARELLYRLGAFATAARGAALTDLGRRLAELPAHPRIARLLVEAQRLGVPASAATLAARISEGALEGLDALAQLEERTLDGGARRSRDQLLSALADSSGRRPSDAAIPAEEKRTSLARAVLSGFSDRVARKRAAGTLAARVRTGDTELVLSSGGSARIENAGVVAESDTFVAIEIQERKHPGQARAQLWVRALAPIDDAWLFDIEPGGVEETQEVLWDEQRERVTAVTRMVYGQIVLTESRAEAATPEAAAPVLLKEALGIDPAKLGALTANEWIAALARVGDSEKIAEALGRLKLAAELFPDWKIPDPSREPLYPHLAPRLGAFGDKDSLRSVDWVEELTAALAGANRRKLDDAFPTAVTLPGGRRTPVRYSLDKAPWLESRMQDFFGMKQGPAVAQGRVPVTLHLLAPNYRAVQVTTDLAGFWERAYPTIRKELSRKYPRHSWPENPRTATPPPPKGKR